MGIGPRDASDMSMWQYQAMLSTWNDRQPGAEAAPDFDRLKAIMAARGEC